MKNLYKKTARLQISAPVLANERRADVVIIGGGYSGLSAALHLAQGGMAPVVLEAAEIGHGGSGRNGGQVNPGLKLLPNELVAHFGQQQGEKLNRLSSDAPKLVFDLIKRYQIDCSPSNTGTIRAAIDQKGLQQVNALVEQASQRGWPVRFADQNEMAQLTGTHIYIGGAVDARGGHLNPLAYVRGLALAAQQAGAALHENSRAISIRRENDRWHVATAQGKVIAPEVIICTDGYSDNLWPGMRKSLVPVYTYIAATDPLPETIKSKIMPCKSALYEAAWDVIYYRVDDEGRLLMGGRGPQRDDKGAKDYQHLIDYAIKLWPELKGINFPWAWQGQVAITKDHLPHLVEPEPGVRLVFGYNGRGVAMSTMVGKIVADLILSHGTSDNPFTIDKNLSQYAFHDFWRVGATGSMMWNIMLDGIKGR